MGRKDYEVRGRGKLGEISRQDFGRTTITITILRNNT